MKNFEHLATFLFLLMKDCDGQGGLFIKGTTTSPNLHIEKSQLALLCPTSHPYAFDNCKKCCSMGLRTISCTIQIKPHEPRLVASDPLDCCKPENSIACSPGRKCRGLLGTDKGWTECPNENPYAFDHGKLCCFSSLQSSTCSTASAPDGILQLEDSSNCCQATSTPCLDQNRNPYMCHDNKGFIADKGKYNLLFVIGGTGRHLTGKVEIVDLSGQGRTCRQDIAHFPEREKSLGAFLKGSIYGFEGFGNNKAYTYNVSNNTWLPIADMKISRSEAVGVVYDESSFLVGAGFSENGIVNSTELYNATSNLFSDHVDLPEKNALFHLVPIRGTSKIMLAGHGYYEYAKHWMFDKTTLEWTRLPDSQTVKMYDMAGYVDFGNGTKIVILFGGRPFYPESYNGRIESFNIQEGVWSFNIPDFPGKQEASSVVPFGNTFLVVGGFDFSLHHNLRTIIKFDPDLEDWVILPEKLQYARSYFASFLVPEGFLSCS